MEKFKKPEFKIEDLNVEENHAKQKITSLKCSGCSLEHNLKIATVIYIKRRQCLVAQVVANSL